MVTRILPPRIELGEGVARLSAAVAMGGETRDLWYEVPQDLASDLTTERVDAFAVGLLVAAMSRGEDLVLEAPISERLYFSLVNEIIPLVALQVANTRAIGVQAAQFDGQRLGHPGRVASGFSAGIDSFCTIYDHFAREERPVYRLSELVFANVGSHGPDPDLARELFRRRLAANAPFATEVGLPLVPIDLNLQTFYRGGFTSSHTLRTLSAMLALQKRYCRYYFSSSYRYDDSQVGIHPSDMAFIDPLIVPLIATENVETHLVGGRYRRYEKLDRIAAYEPSRRYLNACSDPLGTGRNCSRCWKCVRIQIALELLGKAGLFRDVFDADVLRRHRHDHVDRLFAPGAHPGTRDLLSLAAERGVDLRPSLGDRLRRYGRRSATRARSWLAAGGGHRSRQDSKAQ